MSAFSIRGRAALGLVLLAPCALAQPPLAPESVRYDGHKLVLVRLPTVADALRMRGISDTFLGCELRPGENAFAIAPQDLALLDWSGLSYRVLHDNIQQLIDEERARIDQRDRGLESWFNDYHPYAEVVDYLNSLATLYPQLASVTNLGSSVEGRAIHALQITGAGDAAGKAGLYMEGCQHAREWVAVTTPLYIATRLLEDYGVDPDITRLMDEAVFYVVPLVNPDGYAYAWTSDRLWRKNRRSNGGGSYGVDNNRNWAFGWGYDSGSSGNRNSETYRGPAPFSEPENRAVRDFILAHPEIVAGIDFHSYSQMILYPWGYTVDPLPPEEDAIFDALSGSMRLAIEQTSLYEYSAGPASTTLYLASGIAPDWFYGERGILGWTIELRPKGPPGFTLPPEEIIPTGQENLAAIRSLAEATVRRVRVSFPSGAPSRVQADAPGTVHVRLEDVADAYVPGTGALYARVGAAGGFAAAALTDLGGGLYAGELPAAACGESIEYYIELQTAAGHVVREPYGAPAAARVAQAVQITTLFYDDAEQDLGWTLGQSGDTATSGIWNRMDPQGTRSARRAVQPEDDASLFGAACFVTDGIAGDEAASFDVDGGTTSLVSPRFDLGGAADAVVSYWRWFQDSTGPYDNEDVFVVQISNDDGQTWQPLETVGPGTPDAMGGWYAVEFRVSDHLAPSGQMRLRFVASDGDDDSTVEAAIDEVHVFEPVCPDACLGDLSGDGLRDLEDLSLLLNDFGCASGCSADLTGDGLVDLSDLSLFLTVFGIGCP